MIKFFKGLFFIFHFFFSVSDPLFLPPRRETSKRRAKEKTTMKNFLEKQGQDDEMEADDPDFVDSDSDPVWVPGAKVSN